MPLILISGYPSSGKTHRSAQLIASFTTLISTSSDPKIQRLKIHHISDQTLGLSRDVYSTARAEKDARATFYGAIKRVLGRDAIVVADAMNYIKGFRYQLYCEAKAVQTPSCVVHVGTQAPQCREFNDRALLEQAGDGESSGGYDPETFANLIFRYEEPNGMTRWDSPLFTIPFEDPEPPCQAIWDAMIGSAGKTPVIRPNAATVLQPPSEQNYLYELDKTTSDIIALLTAWQRDHPGEGGGEVKIPSASEGSGEAPGSGKGSGEARGLVIELPLTPPSLPQLQRLRRQFVSLNRTHAVGKGRVRDLFVEYLNGAFQG